MASKKSRKSVLIASCVMAALIVGGSTFAWFSSVDEVVNQISASNEYNVVVKENFTPPENWIPGQEITKEVGAVNTGNIDAFVKATLTGNMELKVKSSDTASVRNGAGYVQNAIVLEEDERISKQAGGLLVYQGDSGIEDGVEVDITKAEPIESGSKDIASEKGAGYYIFARSTTENNGVTEVDYAGYYFDSTNYYDVEITTEDGKVKAGIIQTEAKTVNESDLDYSLSDEDGIIKVTYDAGTDDVTTDDIIINLELGDSVATNWTFDLNENGNNNAVFYYNKILPSSESTDYIIQSVTLDSSVKNEAFIEMDYNLKVKVDSAQVSTDDTKTQAVNAQTWAVLKVTNVELDDTTKNEIVTWGTPVGT